MCMTYESLETICENKKVCIWGFGNYGKMYAYWSLVCAGADIISFCDSNYRENCAYHGVPLISKQELFSHSNVLVFVAINDIFSQKNVLNILNKQNIQAMGFDARTFSELCDSIEQSYDQSVISRYSEIMDDEIFLSKIYYEVFGQKLNLDNPVSFNEKIQWLKIHDRNSEYNALVDKALFKEKIKKSLGSNLLIPTLGIWDDFGKINFDKLPDQFVLKCTHDSGSVIICDNKSTFDMNYAREKLERAQATNMYWSGREWPYKNLKARIICEAYLVDESGLELKDYKVFCFNGIPKYIQVDFNRFSKHQRNLYSTDWEYLGFTSKYQTNPNVIIDKPLILDEMLEYSRILSRDIVHSRVDFYVINKKLFIGEITLYHGSGFERYTPSEWDEKLGKLLTISN